ncbi:recombinase family protein [Bacillus toyonensis]|uniref:recombinase family protein n=1 Tax=Bacillus cereus group TaxID=86661 RepID=UPI00065BD721|nr:recombinase family protein [Bacillus cereus]KMP39468.1 resolvase [Bacillus cereus]
MTIYGYARVSTVGQKLEMQEEALHNAGCEVIYSEKFTGTTKERPQFIELMDKIGEGDTLVVTKLDRFARSTKDAIELVTELYERGVIVNVLNLGIIDRSTAAGKLMFNVFAAFAEFERDMIVERTQEGKAAARQKADFREGRPTIAKAQIDTAMMLLKDNSIRKVAQMTGLSVSTIQRYKKKREAAH